MLQRSRLVISLASNEVSITDRAAILAILGAAVQHTGLWIDQDPLVTAAVALGPHDLVAALLQFLQYRVGNAGLCIAQTAVLVGGVTRRRRGAVVLHARRLAGGLHVHAEVEQVAQHL